jgi:hypothetical protein
MKSGSLNLLEPSGPVQACNGIALPFTKKTNEDKLHTVGKESFQHLTFLKRTSQTNKNLSNYTTAEYDQEAAEQCRRIKFSVPRRLSNYDTQNLLTAVNIHENLILCENTEFVHQRFNL